MENINILISILLVFVSVLIFVMTRKQANHNNRKPDRIMNLEKVDYKKVDVQSKKKNVPKTGQNYLVIGSGFLGSHIIDALLERGETKVRIFDIVKNKLYENNPSVEIVQGSVESLEDLKKACKGIDVVFHTAVYICIRGVPFELPIANKVNVLGLQNTLDACVACNVKAFIYTSTSNVVISKEFIGKLLEFDEETPYAKDPLNHYVSTKIQGEKMVIAANSPTGLKTVAIRPSSGIFGPRDNMLLDLGFKTPVLQIVGRYVLDWVYVENIVYAELLAEKALLKNPSKIGGEKFIISNNEPMTNTEFWSIFAYFNQSTLQNIPWALIWLLAEVSTFIQYYFGKQDWLGSAGNLTRSMLALISTDYVGKSSKKAAEMLGYSPLYTVAEAIQKSVDVFKKSSTAKKSS